MWELSRQYMRKWSEFYCRQKVSIGDIVIMTDLVNEFLRWIEIE